MDTMFRISGNNDLNAVIDTKIVGPKLYANDYDRKNVIKENDFVLSNTFSNPEQTRFKNMVASSQRRSLEKQKRSSPEIVSK